VRGASESGRGNTRLVVAKIGVSEWESPVNERLTGRAAGRDSGAASCERGSAEGATAWREGTRLRGPILRRFEVLLKKRKPHKVPDLTASRRLRGLNLGTERPEGRGGPPGDSRRQGRPSNS